MHLDSHQILDVGLHTGQDTRYYLKKGYRVVVIDADPELIEAAADRFAGAIADGQLTLIHGAVTAEAGASVRFFRNPAMSIWGTVDNARAARTSYGRTLTEIRVPAVRLEEVMTAHGVPYFMRVDIEGADTLCLDALMQVPAHERPASLSIESDKEDWANVLREFELLNGLGYNRFAVVQQANVEQLQQPIRTLDGDWVIHRFERDSSGPFGEDLGGPWLDAKQAVDRYRRIFRGYKAVTGVRNWLQGDPDDASGQPAQHQAATGSAARLKQATVTLARDRLRRPLLGWHDTHALRVGPEQSDQ